MKFDAFYVFFMKNFELIILTCRSSLNKENSSLNENMK